MASVSQTPARRQGSPTIHQLHAAQHIARVLRERAVVEEYEAWLAALEAGRDLDAELTALAGRTS